MKKLDASAMKEFVARNIIAVVCVVASLVMLVVINSRASLIADLQNQVAQKTDESRRYHANIANSARLAESERTLAEANQRALARAIHPANIAENLQYFYRLGEKTGVKYSDLRPGDSTAPWAPIKAVKKHPYVLANYNITVTGDFPSVITYLRSLEQGVYFYRLDSMAASGAGAQATVHLSIDLLGQP